MPRQKSRHIDDPVKVGQRLREARLRAGLSQRQLSFEGCTPAYISRVEAGARIPSLQLLRELGKRLGVSADYLATGTETEPAPPVIEAEIALRLGDLETAAHLYAEMKESAGNDSERALALEGIAQIASREGRYRDSVNAFEEAIDLGGWDAVDRPALADSLSRAYAALGELPQSLALLRRSVDRYTGDDPVLYVRFASLLSCALTDHGDFDEAQRLLADALTRIHDAADPYTRARLYWSQSRLLAEQGQAEAAERYARSTLDVLRATEDAYAVAHAIETLAHICLDLGRAEDALSLLEEGEPLIRASGTNEEVAHYTLEQARAFAALGELEKALPLAMEVAGLLQAAPPVSAGRAYQLLAELFQQLGEPARARELYELAIERAEAQPPNKHLVSAYQRLAELLKAQGKRDEALELLERALGIQARILS